MISMSRRFLFVHVPRTAGNAIQRFLGPYSEDELYRKYPEVQDGVERFEVRSAASDDLKKHSSLAEYREILGHDLFEGLFTFAVVRNPWERLVSLHQRTHRGAWDDEAFMSQARRVPKALDLIALSPRQEIVAGRAPLRHDLDLVIRHERLDEGLREACARIGIAFEPLPVVNRVERRHYTEYYSDELREFVSELCEPEIRLFGYAFGE